MRHHSLVRRKDTLEGVQWPALGVEAHQGRVAAADVAEAERGDHVVIVERGERLAEDLEDGLVGVERGEGVQALICKREAHKSGALLAARLGAASAAH